MAIATSGAVQAEANERSDRPPVLVGIPAGAGGPDGLEAAHAIDHELRRLFPDRSCAVLALTRRRGRVAASRALASREHAAPAGGEAPVPQAEPDPLEGVEEDDDVSALLAAAERLQAPAMALVLPEAHDGEGDWLRQLLGPVIDGGYDLVSPLYTRQGFDGAMNNGIVYPLTRALFGLRLRQPVCREVALSTKAARHLLSDVAWQEELARAGPDMWFAPPAISGQLKVCQSHVGRHTGRPAQGDEGVAKALARVLGIVFRGMERHAASWQRTRDAGALATFGAAPPPEGTAPRIDASAMVDAFRLGYRDLHRVWSVVLPPATLLALKRAAEDRSAFRLPDSLWARIVYDFAVGHRVRALERTQLLLSMTPLYLGWVASFVGEMGAATPAQLEERIEALCAEFERSKRYLIGRWRWPDRFLP
jgi:glucosylglycerate synthase